MHNTERDDAPKDLVIADDVSARELLHKVDSLGLRIEQRRPGKPIVCEVVGSSPLELVVVIEHDNHTHTLQALRALHEGEEMVLKRRGGDASVHATLFHCRKAQRAEDHPQLHLANLRITQGSL